MELGGLGGAQVEGDVAYGMDGLCGGAWMAWLAVVGCASGVGEWQGFLFLSLKSEGLFFLVWLKNRRVLAGDSSAITFGLVVVYSAMRSSRCG